MKFNYFSQLLYLPFLIINYPISLYNYLCVLEGIVLHAYICFILVYYMCLVNW